MADKLLSPKAATKLKKSGRAIADRFKNSGVTKEIGK
jgi:hypothetical protein